MHKDKFIAPILHHELESMEVKKSGKVEHSQNSHDDQVFSYLMAMRVWYDGIDLAERYGIQKNTIKTDEDVDIESLSIDDNMYGGMSEVDIDSMVRDLNGNESNIDEQLEFIQQSKSLSYKEFNEQKYQFQMNCLEELLSNNEDVKILYAEKNHFDINDQSSNIIMGNGFVDLPDSIFADIDFDDEEQIKDNNLVGNLSSYWNNLM